MSEDNNANVPARRSEAGRLIGLGGGRWAIIKRTGTILGAGVSTLTVLTAYGVAELATLTISSLLAMTSTASLLAWFANNRLRNRLEREAGGTSGQPQAAPPHGRPWEDQFVHVSEALMVRDAAYVDIVAAKLAAARAGGADARKAAELIQAARRSASLLATCASNIFQSQTQHPCTVTVLILREEEYVDIFARNGTARARTPERRYTLADNAATEHIVTMGDPYYLCNDCAGSPDFFYRSRGWRDRFNNLCVIGIPNPDYERTRQNRYLGFMAVDSQHGRFDRLSCERWAQQFANHLSACLYLYKKLGTEPPAIMRGSTEPEP